MLKVGDKVRLKPLEECLKIMDKFYLSKLMYRYWIDDELRTITYVSYECVELSGAGGWLFDKRWVRLITLLNPKDFK